MMYKKKEMKINKNTQSDISKKFTNDKEYNFVLILRENQKTKLFTGITI